MAKRKRTNNDVQNTTQKTKDRATRTSLRNRMNSGAPEELAVPDPPASLAFDTVNSFTFVSTKFLCLRKRYIFMHI